MGNCIYCQKPAGLFKSRHAECQAKEDARIAEEIAIKERAIKALSSVAAHAMEVRENHEGIQKAIAHAESSGAHPSTIQATLLQQWEAAIDRSLEDGVIDPEELGRLTDFMQAADISKELADQHGHFTKMVKGVVLHELFSGALPQRFAFNGRIPVNLQKDEKIVWAFPDTQYLETRTRIERVGGSQGVSLRIMSGVYYRVGAFKSRPVETTEQRHLDTGWLILTDKNLYFSGPIKATRIPYGKIINTDPYSDGICIMRDAASAKPQLFINNDGWFAYNLLVNLAQR